MHHKDQAELQKSQQAWRDAKANLIFAQSQEKVPANNTNKASCWKHQDAGRIQMLHDTIIQFQMLHIDLFGNADGTTKPPNGLKAFGPSVITRMTALIIAQETAYQLSLEDIRSNEHYQIYRY